MLIMIQVNSRVKAHRNKHIGSIVRNPDHPRIINLTFTFSSIIEPSKTDISKTQREESEAK